MGMRVTRTAWFGPKRLIGWGWSPVTWQGWLLTAAAVAVAGVSAVRWPRASPVPAIVVVVAYLLAVLLTGDPPGGPRSRPDRLCAKTRDSLARVRDCNPCGEGGAPGDDCGN